MSGQRNSQTQMWHLLQSPGGKSVALNLSSLLSSYRSRTSFRSTLSKPGLCRCFNKTSVKSPYTVVPLTGRNCVNCLCSLVLLHFMNLNIEEICFIWMVSDKSWDFFFSPFCFTVRGVTTELNSLLIFKKFPLCLFSVFVCRSVPLYLFISSSHTHSMLGSTDF